MEFQADPGGQQAPSCIQVGFVVMVTVEDVGVGEITIGVTIGTHIAYVT